MTVWIIEPREPLIVRDGRPFTRQPGVMAHTLPFPLPSTTTGAARGLAGSRDGQFVLTGTKELEELQRVSVRGPLLVEYTDKEKWSLLVPAPGDALLLEKEKLLRCLRLQPVNAPGDAKYAPFRDNLHPDGSIELLPIGPSIYDPAKPAKGPAFWKWETFENWLVRPDQSMDRHLFSSEELGVPDLPQDERIHVALEYRAMVAREGGLFETRGLEFTSRPEKDQGLKSTRRLALWLDVQGPTPYRMQEGLSSLGGERRMVSWQRSTQEVPTCPSELRDRIVEKRACRLILLTPAHFTQGYLPDVQKLAYQSAVPEIKAALTQRPQVVSGWDININKPKPTRRLAPAGSVYFLTFPDLAERADIEQWIEQTWMHCISDQGQDRLDGFGLAALGTWGGKPGSMDDPRHPQQKEQN